MPDRPEFDHCLRCGQPLRSWLSRHEGLGLHCAERLTRSERRRLLTVARAVASDLKALERGPERPSISYRLALLALVWREWRRDEC